MCRADALASDTELHLEVYSTNLYVRYRQLQPVGPGTWAEKPDFPLSELLISSGEEESIRLAPHTALSSWRPSCLFTTWGAWMLGAFVATDNIMGEALGKEPPA